MKLYSAWYCPFAQRVWISLLYKQIKFEYIEIDPYNKTKEWLELSKNTAQVPAIIVNNKNIVDSTQIVSQLDELFPRKSAIFSTNSTQRKDQSLWIIQINKIIVPYFYRYLMAHIDGQYRRESEQALVKGIFSFSKALSSEGPYFGGKEMSAVDISLFPFSYRIKVLLAHYRNFSLPTTGNVWKQYHMWYEAMLDRPEFKETSIDIPDYEGRLIDIYLPYSQGEGQEDVTLVSDKN